MITIKVQEFAEQMKLTVLNEGRGFFTVDGSDYNRPGLQFSGFFVHFAFGRIQLLGNSEIHYLKELETSLLRERLEMFMSYNVPAIICARSWTPMEELMEAARNHNIPVLLSERTTTKIGHAINNYLDRKLAPSITRHGVLLDVYGVGVMLMGESGLGKSEAALEMIKRGHRLVADDVVEITRVSDRLIGHAPEATRHLMEVRGIGIIDVRYLYGMAAIMPEKNIDLVIDVELWNNRADYERFGVHENTVDILGIEVPHMVLPISPGRNLAVLTEIATRNFRLKRLGYKTDAALVDTMSELWEKR